MNFLFEILSTMIWYCSLVLKYKGSKVFIWTLETCGAFNDVINQKKQPLLTRQQLHPPLTPRQYSHWNFFELMTWFLVPSVIYYTCNYSVLFYNFKNYTSMVSKYYLYINFLKNNQKFSSRFIPVCPSDDHIQHPFWT